MTEDPFGADDCDDAITDPYWFDPQMNDIMRDLHERGLEYANYINGETGPAFRIYTKRYATIFDAIRVLMRAFPGPV